MNKMFSLTPKPTLANNLYITFRYMMKLMLADDNDTTRFKNIKWDNPSAVPAKCNV